MQTGRAVARTRRTRGTQSSRHTVINGGKPAGDAFVRRLRARLVRQDNHLCEHSIAVRVAGLLWKRPPPSGPGTSDAPGSGADGRNDGGGEGAGGEGSSTRGAGDGRGSRGVLEGGCLGWCGSTDCATHTRGYNGGRPGGETARQSRTIDRADEALTGTAPGGSCIRDTPLHICTAAEGETTWSARMPLHQLVELEPTFKQ